MIHLRQKSEYFSYAQRYKDDNYILLVFCLSFNLGIKFKGKGMNNEIAVEGASTCMARLYTLGHIWLRIIDTSQDVPQSR